MAKVQEVARFSKLQSRIRRPALLSKVRAPESLIPFFKNGQYLGWSGFTGVGYPKVMPNVLADHVERNNLRGKLRCVPASSLISLISLS